MDKRNSRLRWVVVLGLTVGGFALPVNSWADSVEQAEELQFLLPEEATQVKQKLQALQGYRTRFTMEAMEETGEVVKLQGRLSVALPNRRRLEIRPFGAKEPAQVIVSDGRLEWQYYPDINTVYRTKSEQEIPGPHRPFAEIEAATLSYVGSVGEDAQAKLRFQGTPLPSVVYGSPILIETIQIDVSEEAGLVQELILFGEKGETALAQRYFAWELNPVFDDREFHFTVPVGVALVDLENRSGPGISGRN